MAETTRGGGSSSPSIERPTVFIPDAWAEKADAIAYDAETSPPPVTLICGAKNTGKSTFSRHLLNTLLTRYKRVAYLETDLGQPEFTAPGCLSLHVIDKPTPDLTILCVKTPERCIFYGDVSSKRDPKSYLNNIFSLYDYFRMQYRSSRSEISRKAMLPLVINTPGWIKGTGYDMLVEMLRYFVPTHVVKIRITVDSKNLPPGAFWLDKNEEVQVNVIDIDAARQDSSKRSVLVRKDARLMRDLRLIAYFRQCFPSDMNITTYKELAHALASLPPYQVPISAVKVMHLHCEVPNNENFHSLNATIVGLAMNYGKSADSTPCVPWCFGLGIVRSIDVSNGLLYIITPVPRCNLEKVDLLLQGFIEIPTCLLQVSGCLSPYMSTNVMHRIEAPDMNAQPRCQSHAVKFMPELSTNYL
ncbi:Polynucleotide 5'-hydroxyl-kinase NOL9 [Acorus calamus]|uniref:Polynucleotide 5'-hydroxyl-kinase NOL9 n=1 Tax=Acorus calamus TaxID=4465 RepID=A0AAV9DAF9_ACOCL|nr:Polynucleotide 5'-hydroxyl-kinase NOL9 [Acorus calamus]